MQQTELWTKSAVSEQRQISTATREHSLQNREKKSNGKSLVDQLNQDKQNLVKKKDAIVN